MLLYILLSVAFWPARPPLAQDASPSLVEVLDIDFPQRIAGNLPSSGGWLPAYVELRTSSRESQTVVLEGSVTEQQKKTFVTRERIEVAPGAPRRAWVNLRVGPTEQIESARIDIRSLGGAVVGRGGPWSVTPGGQDGARLSLLVVGESLGDVTPWPGSLSRSSGMFESFQEAADACTAKMLPDSLLGYQAFDMVILRDLGAQSLEKAQVEALKSWVYLGGHVILAPRGRSAEIFRSDIAKELLGDALTDPVAGADFAPEDIFAIETSERVSSHRVAEAKDIFVGKTRTYTTLDPLRVGGAREITSVVPGPMQTVAQAPRRLYADLLFGRGRAAVLTFDDQTYRDAESANFLRAFWTQIVSFRLASAKGALLGDVARVQIPDLVEALRDPSREVGVNVMIGLIGGYLVVAGPVLYFLLKRWNRLPAVIWAEPLLVVVYLGVIFATAYVTKGVFTKTRLLTFITQREGDRLAFRESYLSIFSAAEASYRITSSGASALLRPIYKNAAEERATVYSRGKAGEMTLEEFALAHWQEGHVSSAGVMDLSETGVEIRDVDGVPGGPAHVVITNRLPYAIREGIYYDGRARFSVPAVEPGKTVEVSMGKPLEESKHERRFQRFAAGHGQGGDLRLAADIARDDEDFRIDQRTTMKERLDYFLLYR